MRSVRLFIEELLMPVPEITHLQFLVLEIIGALERPGRYIREQLQKEGARKSLPAFYQMMARLEDAGLIKGSTHAISVEGQPATERRYKITGSGLKALQQVKGFYSDSALTAIRGRGVRHA
jgi:DNA-binding PadR family transcriptional regulator